MIDHLIIVDKALFSIYSNKDLTDILIKQYKKVKLKDTVTLQCLSVSGKSQPIKSINYRILAIEYNFINDENQIWDRVELSLCSMKYSVI